MRKGTRRDAMIKVIAADMDGTLLNSLHTLSGETYRTIQDVQRSGIRFMIATGERFSFGEDTLRKLSAAL